MNGAIYLQFFFFSFFFLLIFQHVALFSRFLLFFLFFPRRSVPLIVACLFLFFLFTSFNSSIFLCPFRWCRVVMLKTVTRYILNPWRTLLAHAPNWDTYRRNDNRRSNKRRKKEDAGRLLYKYILPLTVFVRVRKGVQGLHVKGCWDRI